MSLGHIIGELAATQQQLIELKRELNDSHQYSLAGIVDRVEFRLERLGEQIKQLDRI